MVPGFAGFLHMGGTELAMPNSVTVSIQSITLYTAGRPEMDQKELLQATHFNIALMWTACYSFWHILTYFPVASFNRKRGLKRSCCVLPCCQALFSDLLMAIATHASGFTQPKLDASHEQCESEMAMDQYLFSYHFYPFLVGWTSILTQLFWCELQGFSRFWHTAR